MRRFLPLLLPLLLIGACQDGGGTPRLPRLVGTNKALEMNLVGDPVLDEEAFELGLVNRVGEDHELLDTALRWARKLAGQAPLAVGEIKSVSGKGDLDAGIAARTRRPSRRRSPPARCRCRLCRGLGRPRVGGGDSLRRRART